MMHWCKPSSEPLALACQLSLVSLAITTLELRSQRHGVQLQSRVEEPQSKLQVENQLAEQAQDPPDNRSSSAQAEAMAMDLVEVREEIHLPARCSCAGLPTVHRQVRKTLRKRTQPHQR